MSLSTKRESHARIHGRYQRASRPHQRRTLDEFYTPAVISLLER